MGRPIWGPPDARLSPCLGLKREIGAPRLAQDGPCWPIWPATQRSTASLPRASAAVLARPADSGRLRGSDRLASMYIRVKRNKTTYFIQCDPTETILNIKQKLQSITDHPPNNQRLILLATNNILDDSKTLADQKVENDAVVALALRKGSVLVSLGFMFDTYALNV
ncbi:Polyubiquitin-C [Triticum urartu]|uniref:Polyubiquitin-C n=1 Tax=Triticum urartu TaxID=4572 RepID=M7ZSN6_TRIUA|nr:Polyubiquitin-C [Triticum urartu]